MNVLVAFNGHELVNCETIAELNALYERQKTPLTSDYELLVTDEAHIPHPFIKEPILPPEKNWQSLRPAFSRPNKKGKR